MLDFLHELSTLANEVIDKAPTEAEQLTQLVSRLSPMFPRLKGNTFYEQTVKPRAESAAKLNRGWTVAWSEQVRIRRGRAINDPLNIFVSDVQDGQPVLTDFAKQLKSNVERVLGALGLLAKLKQIDENADRIQLLLKNPADPDSPGIEELLAQIETLPGGSPERVISDVQDLNRQFDEWLKFLKDEKFRVDQRLTQCQALPAPQP